MTPAARLQAAIEILELTRAGAPAEQVLTNWARAHRFAGSGDRAAIRDLVYDALRCRGSFAALGGGEGGRALMLGAARARGEDPAALFDGARHAPAALSEEERAALAAPAPDAQALARADWPAWLLAPLEDSLGAAAAAAVLAQMRARAPVFLRVNLARIPRAQAIAALAEEGITAVPVDLAGSALEVTAGARKIAGSAAYREGLVELQDAASQAVAETLPLAPGARVLDYCAGGGGKALALAARAPEARISAHDIDAGRMRDLPERAARAGARIKVLRPGQPGGPYDLVVVDAPCSGSGTWRRTPEAKWRLTPARLAELTALQREILTTVVPLVAPGGTLAYMTCSLLRAENDAQADWIAQETGWPVVSRRALSPLEGADGFYCAQIRRPA